MSWNLALFLTGAWCCYLAFLYGRLRPPGKLPGGPADGSSVSIIIPARNEEVNIGRCLRSIIRSRYEGDLEVIVVDDRSIDGTARVVKEVADQSGAPIKLIRGKPLPDGWMGKPWACHQGAEAARGELLLFTDADTRHGPDLLSLVVGTANREKADVVSVVGRQEMVTFWEKLVQPHVFFAIALVIAPLGRPYPRRKWRTAITNGQYTLHRRRAYEKFGGHRRIRFEVVEDVRTGQLMTREGYTVITGFAPGLATRMYRSLSEVFWGWTKNFYSGVVLFRGRIRAVSSITLSFILESVLFLGPIILLATAPFTDASQPLLALAAFIFASYSGIFALATFKVGGSPWYGILHPVGGMARICIGLASLVLGRRVSWKGRTYRLRR